MNRGHFTLDEDVVFLNHGSFGACPKAVTDFQAGVRAELEREPVRFFTEVLPGRLDGARREAARFVGARPEDFVFVRNSTSAVNAVLRSLELGPGDEILTTDHAYNACKNALSYTALRSGTTVRSVPVPLPVKDPGDVVERLVSSVTDRTRLALVDHVTSETGLVFPIRDIVAALRERGVETLVDGAHAPGMVALDLADIGAAYYAGNFHKWVCAPKGAALLVVREDRQAGIHPLSISHGYGSVGPRARFLEEFDWTGTDDPSPWLSVPVAIRFLEGLVEGGWAAIRERNRRLSVDARHLLEDRLGAASIAPDSMIGSLASIRLPDSRGPASPSTADEPLHRALLDRHRIQVPVFSWPAPPKRFVRISAHLYNTREEYERLGEAVVEELSRR